MEQPGPAARPVHAPVRPDWLARGEEPLATCDLPIVDAHHHLWDRPGDRYLAEEFTADLDTVPQVVASVYVQARSGYRAGGPESMRPVGEVEFARHAARVVFRRRLRGPRVARAMVAGADLALGRDVLRVVDAMDEVAAGTLRGIRNQTAWHADPAVSSSPVPPRPGRLLDPGFREGVAALATRGLTLDVWAYHTQLREVLDLATACPDTTIVLDHFGGPLGVGPHAGRTSEVLQEWRTVMALLARRPNVVVKLSGAGLRVFGSDFDQRASPPTSIELAAFIEPWLHSCLDLFGADRCLFASNFPVDKGMFSYRTLWNAFTAATTALSPSERGQLFHGTADKTYRLRLSELADELCTQQEVTTS